MNQIAVDFIKAHEGCDLHAYKDQGGVVTIGYGTTGHGIQMGDVWSEGQADAMLGEELAKVEVGVLKILRRKLSQQSLAALDSFAYNLGLNALASSHLLQCVNAGDDLGAAKAFLNWDHIGSSEVKGLLIRRMEEAVLYLRGV